jgi:hypothetical protein
MSGIDSMKKEPVSFRVAGPFEDRLRNASYSKESFGSEIVGLAYGRLLQREQFDSARKFSVPRFWSERKQYRVHFAGKRFFIVSHILISVSFDF